MGKFQFNNYRLRKIKNVNLVTTDHGSWTFLDNDELAALVKEKPGKDLQSKLIKNGLLITDNIDDIIKKTRERYYYLFQGTSLHIVVPTLRCNYQCTYCHASAKYCNSKKFDMTEKTAKKVVDFIFQSTSNSITIEFQGGEPLLNFEIIKFVTNYASQKNKKEKKDLKITLVSNLSLMDEKKMEFLLKNKIDVCTSFDGPRKVHDANRKFLSGAGSYDTTIKKIKKLRKKVRINALTTITKSSLPHPTEIVDEYVKQGFNLIHIRYLNNLGYAKKEWEKIGYSPEEFIKFWKECINHIIKLNKKGISIKERGASIILHKLFSIDPNFLDLRSPCGAAIGQLLYNYDGRIYTCDEGRMVNEDLFCIGNVDCLYKNVLTCPETCAIVAASVNDASHCDFCVYKPFCGLCPVCNYVEHGNILAKIPETRRCKIFKAQFDYIFELIQDPKNKKILIKWIEDH